MKKVCKTELFYTYTASQDNAAGCYLYYEL